MPPNRTCRGPGRLLAGSAMVAGGGGLESAVQVKITESVSSNNGSGEDVTTVTFGGTRLDIVGLVQRSVLWSAFLVIRIIRICLWNTYSM